jgi:hypothetical protein
MDYDAERARYKPSKLRALFIAESPPLPHSNRFFYFEKGMERDLLFLETIRACFPQATMGKSAREIRLDKSEYLDDFKSKGFYLIDATDTPIAGLSKKQKLEALSQSKEFLQDKVRQLIKGRTPIILISHSVWQTHSESLKSLGYNVAHKKPIPFPAFGHQPTFRTAVTSILELNGLI